MKKVNCILLVDDNSADNDLHDLILQSANVCDHIQVAFNGEKALAYILKSGELNQPESYPKPDIIFLDINMPIMNGYEFLEEYHKLNENLKSKIVIIMLSVPLTAEDEKKIMAYTEVTSFVDKPLTTKGVQDLVAKYF